MSVIGVAELSEDRLASFHCHGHHVDAAAVVVVPSIAPLHGAVHLEAIMMVFPPLPASLVTLVSLVAHLGKGLKQASGLHFYNSCLI